MQEKIDELYEQYLTEKLDAIFFDENGVKHENKLLDHTWFKNAYSFDDGLTVVKEYGEEYHEKYVKCNFADKSGNIISKTWFDEVWGFSEGFAVVKKDDQYNFIDKNGKLISDTWYSNAWKFKDGYARIRKNGKCNFIDKSGKLISDKWYEEAYEFTDGYSVIGKNNKYNILKFNFIDKNGKNVSNIWFDNAWNFCDGIALVYKDKKYNYINTNGDLISKIWFDDALSFANGFGKVVKNNKKNYIDTNGKLISEIWFDNIWSFCDGYAIVENDGKYNYIDQNGKLLSDTWYDGACNFQDGIAFILEDEKYNYIDTKGNYIIDKSFDKINSFHNGVAIVCKNDKYNLIDKKGNLICDIWFDRINNFLDDYFQVEKDNQYNLIDKDGKEISKIWFSGIENYNDEFIIVYQNHKCNLMDKTGKLISNEWFDEIEKFSGYLPIDKKTEKYSSFYTDSNERVCKPKYGYFRVCKNKKYNYMDSSGKLLSDIWFDKANIFSWDGKADVRIGFKETQVMITQNFFIIEDVKAVPFNIDMNDYKVKKNLIGYECSKDNDKIQLKYMPIKKYGSRHILCLNKNMVLLYDKNDNKYYEINAAENIAYDDNFIIDKSNNKVYLMYENQIIEITKYYKTKLANKHEFSITGGITDILSKGEFAVLNDAQIHELLSKEEKRRQEKKKEKKLCDLKDNLNQLKQELLEKNQLDEVEIQKMLSEAWEKINEGIKSLDAIKKMGIKENVKKRVTVENIFVNEGDHIEIDKDYRGLLKFIDLTLYSFDNVNVCGLDFTGTNIYFGGSFFNPQKVYNKDLRGCDFTGIYIEPMANFTGVDIRGAKFSVDDKEETYDMFNITFKNAIYDDTTTYNGQPIKLFLELERKNQEERMAYLASLSEGYHKNRA